MGSAPLTANRIALALSVVGVAALVAGVALIYVPAALIVGGSLALGLGLFGVDVE